MTAPHLVASGDIRSNERPGAVATMLFAAAAGLTLVTLGNAVSRSGHYGGDAVFWAGLLTILIPGAWMSMASTRPPRERLFVVLIVTTALYAVKLVHDPFTFTFADEFVHQHNANEILRTGRLFAENPILPVTPSYPGLPAVTAALSAVTGLSTFAAGTVVIGAARILMTLALYHLVYRLSGSWRAGAIAVLVYASAPNFLFFTAQFAYESLALPIAVTLVFAVAAARQAAQERGSARPWTAVALVLIPAVAVTHHLTSYALVIVLAAVCLASVVLPGTSARKAPWLPALVALISVVGWLLVAGGGTSRYLSPVLTRAFRQTLDVVSRGEPTRQLFGNSAGTVTPLWERIVVWVSVLVLLAWLAVGLRSVRRRLRTNAALTVVVSAVPIYVAMLPLRLVSAAWELSLRASEFLFVGIATVVGLSGLDQMPFRRLRHGGRILACAALAVIVAGGVILGWSSIFRPASPFRLAVSNSFIEPPAAEAARWMLRELGPDNRVAAEQADGRFLMTFGRQRAFVGVFPDVEDFLHAQALEDWHLELLETERIAYVAVDRRGFSADLVAGYFFRIEGTRLATTFPKAVVEKLRRDPRTDVIYDSGDVVIYDVRRLRRDATAR